ncbi:winged helix-turn-helix domain-containing protein [Sphingomonas sp. RB56-2]|uniref:Winged helix-turn-helix domain-containing protein n=1 Tax=Sphingomonas brevis TaxID=2908206 RepID=A0ABT0SC30_9SPHN|nr:winged helix-turn-helix domain-containing protein [Sphingomonas brevis]MCL6741975.1 winged helix-turn-helix domain-containing protein [Sphingomonas brevis]
MILVVSHRESERRYLSRILAGAGFAAIAVASLEDAEAATIDRTPSVMIADLGREPGIEPGAVRNSIAVYFETPIEVPVIAIVPKRCAELGTAALAAGAIDVLFRPLVERELLIRLRSVLKRWHVAMTPAPLIDGKLTLVENKILAHLDARRGKPVANDELIGHLGGIHSVAHLRLLIAGLRQKLHLHSPPRSIATVRGVGYSLIVD